MKNRRASQYQRKEIYKQMIMTRQRTFSPSDLLPLLPVYTNSLQDRSLRFPFPLLPLTLLHSRCLLFITSETFIFNQKKNR